MTTKTGINSSSEVSVSRGMVRISTGEKCKLKGHEFLVSYKSYQEIIDYVIAMHQVSECDCELVGVFPSFELYPKDFTYFRE